MAKAKKNIYEVDGKKIEIIAPALRFRHPGTGQAVTMKTEDILKDKDIYGAFESTDENGKPIMVGGKTLAQIVFGKSLGEVPTETEEIVGHKKNAAGKVINTDGKEILEDGGKVAYETRTIYSGIARKA